jgi:hypothetical protein
VARDIVLLAAVLGATGCAPAFDSEPSLDRCPWELDFRPRTSTQGLDDAVTFECGFGYVALCTGFPVMTGARIHLSTDGGLNRRLVSSAPDALELSGTTYNPHTCDRTSSAGAIARSAGDFELIFLAPAGELIDSLPGSVRDATAIAVVIPKLGHLPADVGDRLEVSVTASERIEIVGIDEAGNLLEAGLDGEAMIDDPTIATLVHETDESSDTETGGVRGPMMRIDSLRTGETTLLIRVGDHTRAIALSATP